MEADKATTDSTLPPGCETLPLPPPPLSQPLLPTVHLFHDSNLKDITPNELAQALKNVKKQASISLNISPHATYTLPQTFNTIKETTFQKDDIVVITTLTNDARNTKHRQARNPTQTKQTQMKILNHLKQFISPHNIIILESPPLLTSPHSDIYNYNNNSFLLSKQLGTRFAETLVGESQIYKDGYHILRSARHLLIKSVAAAVFNINPHRHFGLPRPPFGNFGPWTTPIGQGLLPSPSPTFRGAAMAQPINFRRAHIYPLMNLNIQQSRRSN